MPDRIMLPTFFVIGASKSGTTSLHHYLGLHPEIAMSEPKEPGLMSFPDYREQAHRYREFFAAARPIRGESSPRYSFPGSAALAHIAELVPDARIIYLVRDPVERAIAHYAHRVIQHKEQRPISEAIRADDPGCPYVTNSRYGTVLEGCLRHFDRDAVLVVDSRELRDNRRETLSRILSHVGADPAFSHEGYEREHMVRSADNIMLGGRTHRFTQSRAGHLYRRTVPARLRKRIRARLRRLLGGREVRPEAGDELRERLAERLRPEADRLRELTGQRFESWSV